MPKVGRVASAALSVAGGQYVKWSARDPVWPETPGPALAMMEVYWEGTRTCSGPRIRAMGACKVLYTAIESQVPFGPDDFGFCISRAGHDAQYMPKPEVALRHAIEARNASAAASIERSMGRTAWWHVDGGRHRLFLGAELKVRVEGVRRWARVTAFVANTHIRLKVWPDDCPVPTTGFRLVEWDRAILKAHAPAPVANNSEEESEACDD